MKEDQIKKLNDWFTNGYGILVYNAKNFQNLINEGETGIIHEYDYKDCINNSYLKIRDKIEKDGLEHSINISGYTLITLRNEILNAKYEATKREYVDIMDNKKDVHEALTDIENSINSTDIYLDEIRYLSKMIFQYLENRYDDKDLQIFKIYFLNSKMTYRKVAGITNYSIGHVSECIKIIKKDLKNNLLNYINNQ